MLYKNKRITKELIRTSPLCDTCGLPCFSAIPIITNTGERHVICEEICALFAFQDMEAAKCSRCFAYSCRTNFVEFEGQLFCQFCLPEYQKQWMQELEKKQKHADAEFEKEALKMGKETLGVDTKEARELEGSIQNPFE